MSRDFMKECAQSTECACAFCARCWKNIENPAEMCFCGAVSPAFLQVTAILPLI